MALHLAVKEIWKGRGRFLLFSMVVALITMLVLFIAGLASGLSAANREYLSKLDAELIVYQENSDYLINASRLSTSKVQDVRRVGGVQEVGVIALTNASVWQSGSTEPFDVTLIGVEPGKPGSPWPKLGARCGGRARKRPLSTCASPASLILNRAMSW